MTKENTEKLSLLQILVCEETIKDLKRQAIDRDLDSHRVYAAKLLNKVVQLIKDKKLSIEI